MVRVRNKHEHMKGRQVLVNGNRYLLNEDGEVDVDEADALKMRVGERDSAWRAVDGKAAPKKQPVKKAPPPEPVEEEDEGDEEWPEPDEDMDIEYLREMADAYEVDYTSRTRASTLVKRINEAREGEE